MYEQQAQAAQAAQGAGPDMGQRGSSMTASSQSDDDVVDGDYKEV